MVKNKNGLPQDVKTVLFWGLGIGILGMTLLILLIIFGNLSGNMGFEDGSQGMVIINESCHLNGTGYTLSGYNSTWSSITATAVWANKTSGWTPYLVPSTNYSLSTVGVLTNTTVPNNATEFNTASISYTYAFSYTTQAETDAENVIGNYTKSAVNTSKQFPVTGTILGIALLLAILIGILVFAIRKMMGVASASGGSSSSSGSFDRAGFR